MPFDPKVTSKQECIITTFQDVYFVSDSFEEAKVKMRWGRMKITYKLHCCFIYNEISTTDYSMTILCSFQGVCQDHQASLHSPIQPLHPECGRAKRHSQHQQRGGGASTWAWHRRWRPQPAEQAAGCLTAHTLPLKFIHLQSTNACRVIPQAPL